MGAGSFFICKYISNYVIFYKKHLHLYTKYSKIIYGFFLLLFKVHTWSRWKFVNFSLTATLCIDDPQQCQASLLF